MQIDTRLSEQIGRYLDLATAEARVTAANMANIDTPGYRAAGMDFEAEMSQAMNEVDRGWNRDKGSGLGGRSPHIRPVDGLVARPDGNNVSMDRESLNLAEAQLRYKTGVTLLKGQYQTILDAIHAADK